MPEEDKKTVVGDSQEKSGDASQKTNGEAKVVDAKSAEEVGRLKQKSEEFDAYKKRTDAVIQTIWSNKDLYDMVLKEHKKRLGFVDEEADEDKKVDGKSKEDNKVDGKKEVEVPKVDPVTIDNRKYLFKKTVNDWESSVGLDKLDSEKRTEVNAKVGNVLSRMLDPKGRGTPVDQLLADVSLEKLNNVLNDAYYLATKEDREAEIKRQTESEITQAATGMIGSMPSGSVSSEEIKLTPREKAYALRMGIEEKAYLKNKIEIANRRGSLA